MQTARRLAPRATLRVLQRNGDTFTASNAQSSSHLVECTVRRFSVAVVRSVTPKSSKIQLTEQHVDSSVSLPSAALFDRATARDAGSEDVSGVHLNGVESRKKHWKPVDRAPFRKMLVDCLNTGLVSATLRKYMADYPIMTTPWTDQELVLLVCALIKSNRSEQALELLHIQIKDATDKNRLNRVAAESARLGNAFVALGVLDIARHFHIKPDVVTYTSAIHACARAGRDEIPQAIEILDEMLDDGIEPNHRTYGAVVLAYARMNKWEEVDDLVNGIRFHDQLTKCDVYSSAIAACAHNRQFMIATKLYAQLMDAGVYPGEKVSNAALSAYARTADMEQIHKVMAFIEEHGEPSIYTYNSMLSAYSLAGRIDDALAIYQRMQNKKCGPDAVTFNALLLGASRSRRLDLVPLMLDNMSARGITWDVYTLNALLDVCAVQRSVENAWDFWRRAGQEQKLHYDRTNFETLFGVFYDCGEYQAVIDLWRHNRYCRRRAKSAKSLNYLLRACSKLGDVTTATAFLDEFVMRGQAPTAIAHNHILAAYLKADDWSGALTQLQLMTKEQALTTVFAFTAMMKHAYKKLRYDNVLSTYDYYVATCEKFKAVWCPHLQYPPDAVYLLAAYAAAALHDHKRLVHLYQALPRTLVSTTVATEIARLVLASCEEKDDWRCAVALYGELSKRLHDDTNVELYEIVVKIVARAGAFERALEVNGGEWYRDNRHDKGWFN